MKKYVWLTSRDAVHRICKAESCENVDVFCTKGDVLRFWKDHGDVELLGEPISPNTITAVWHRINGENVLMVATRHTVNTYEKKGKKK